MKRTSKVFSRIFNIGKYSLLPILLIIYFFTFHYSNNAAIVTLSKSILILFPLIGFAIISFIAYFYLFLNQISKAAIASSVILIFLLVYGLIFDWLFRLNFLTIKHYSFLPFFLISSFYITFSIKSFSHRLANIIWKTFTIIFIGLTLFNIVRIIPVEIKKLELSAKETKTDIITDTQELNSNGYPDIYYIILDEAAGFDVVSDFFGYSEIDNFITFLKDNGFYVAEDSKTEHLNSILIMAERLNFKVYPDLKKDGELIYFEAITDNQVMQYLKDKGYSTAVFSELGSSIAYPTMPSFTVDYSFKLAKENTINNSTLSNDFVGMIIKQTIFRPFYEQLSLENEVYKSHASMITSTMTNIAKIDEINSPKFVYAHLIFPHLPFMFDKHGNILDQKQHNNWDNYLGQYIYSMSVAEEMIKSILETSDPQRPPVIILQSDHGARNGDQSHVDFKPLKDYPEEYRYHIINALSLPNCEKIELTQDINPINTFPLVFNCLFNDDIPLK